MNFSLRDASFKYPLDRGRDKHFEISFPPPPLYEEGGGGTDKTITTNFIGFTCLPIQRKKKSGQKETFGLLSSAIEMDRDFLPSPPPKGPKFLGSQIFIP